MTTNDERPERHGSPPEEIPEADGLEQGRTMGEDAALRVPPQTPEADAQEQARPGEGDAPRRPPGDEVPEADAAEQGRAP